MEIFIPKSEFEEFGFYVENLQIIILLTEELLVIVHTELKVMFVEFVNPIFLPLMFSGSVAYIELICI